MKTVLQKLVIFTCFPFFILSIFTLEAVEGRLSQQTLLLHIDVNRTIVAIDSATEQTKEQTLNTLLAENFYYTWHPELTEMLSYKDYVENYLIPGSSHDTSLKLKRRALLNDFIHFLTETHHPLENEVIGAYNLLDTQLQEGVIFPSFINLIVWLKEKEIPYRIILRTFGKDIQHVVEEISRISPRDAFFAQGYFEKGKMFLTHEGACTRYCCPLGIYLALKHASGHLALRDSWQEWHDHDESREYGKLFPLDCVDADTLSLFFDDNIKLTTTENGSNIINPIDIRTGEKLNIVQLYDRKWIFPVNTYEAILDNNYFIKLVELALARISHKVSEKIAAPLVEIGQQLGEDSVALTRPHPTVGQDQSTECASFPRICEKCGLARESVELTKPFSTTGAEKCQIF